MLKVIRIGAFASVFLVVAGGVAKAEPAQLANLDQLKMVQEVGNLHIALKGATIESVPNMAAAVILREGFVSATASLTVEGLPPDLKARTTLSLKAQLGCQGNVSDGADVTLSPTFFTSLPNLDLTPSPDDVSLAPTASMTPQVEVRLKPGEITETPLGQGAFPSQDALFADQSQLTDTLKVSVQNFHITITNCLGAVSIRFRVVGTMTTASSFDSVDAFSDIVPL